MKRKILGLLLAVLGVCSLAVIGACGKEIAVPVYSSSEGQLGSQSEQTSSSSVYVHSHDFSILKYDENDHWYECVCGEKGGETAHSGGTATCTEKAVCELCKQEYGDFAEHDYEDLEYDDEKHWYECACGEKDGEVAHSGGTATCKAKAVCSVCDKTYGTIGGHTIKNAICTICKRDFTTKGLVYTRRSKDTCQVSYYEGTSVNVYIPAVYDGLSVIAIGNGAFRNNKNIESVVLPDSVTSIHEFAFAECSRLESIQITSNITSVADFVFYCTGGIKNYNEYENGFYLGDENNPYHVLIYGKVPNETCSAFTIHEDTKIVYQSAFNDCSYLTSITIPNGVMTIGDAVFSGCGNLKSVYYMGNVESWCNIDFNDAYGCSNPLRKTEEFYINNQLVTELIIPDTVTQIKRNAFREYSGLKSITISNSVTSIGEWAFADCSELTSIKFDGTIEEWNKIKKDSDWNKDVPATKVVCSGGEVAL